MVLEIWEKVNSESSVSEIHTLSTGKQNPSQKSFPFQRLTGQHWKLKGKGWFPEINIRIMRGFLKWTQHRNYSTIGLFHLWHFYSFMERMLKGWLQGSRWFSERTASVISTIESILYDLSLDTSTSWSPELSITVKDCSWRIGSIWETIGSKAEQKTF